MTKTCEVCGAEFWPRPRERPATFRMRKRCGFYCRPVARPDQTGRSRAEAAYPHEMPCEVCGKTGKGRGVIDRHHRDGDRLNNSSENIAFLCRKDHIAAHRVLDGRVGGGVRPRVNAMLRAKAVARSAEAARMRDTGQTTNQIAASMGVNPWTVLRWFRKYETP